MNHYTPLFLVVLVIVSCSTEIKHINNGYSEMALLTDGLEEAYIGQSLSDLSNVSKMARDYKEQLSSLEKKTNGFKALFVLEHSVPSDLQYDFINSFEKSLKFVTTRDSNYLELLRKTPAESLNDIDRLSLFMKRSYLNQYLETERYLFNTLSTVGVAENSNVKKGENISVTMNLTAANTDRPAEWFILRDGGESLSKGNISDTLHPDRFARLSSRKRPPNLETIQLCMPLNSNQRVEK